jgi:dimethylamine/trimethylamine dehydrogenase
MTIPPGRDPRYDVVLIEASREIDGRVAREALLPGLASWIRVLECRRTQIDRMKNVEYYYESAMTADEILEYGFDHIAVGTGATWRRDGVGYAHTYSLEIDQRFEILAPDDLIAGTRPKGKDVVIFDDDHFYMGGVLAELLTNEGYPVTLVTPVADVSPWTHNTMEQHRNQARPLDIGVTLITAHTVMKTDADGVVPACVYTGQERHHRLGHLGRPEIRRGSWPGRRGTPLPPERSPGSLRERYAPTDATSP